MDNVIKIELANHKVPEMKEVKRAGAKYIAYGEKNDYPQYLAELLTTSALHNAIVTGVVHYVVGNGFDVKAKDTESEVQVLEFMQEVNQYDNFNDVLTKAITDYKVYGGFAIEYIWNADHTRVVEIYHVDFSKIRSNENNTEFYFSNEWGQFTNKFETIQGVGTGNDSKQLFYYKDYRTNIKTYPLPDYVGAVSYIEIDANIANHHLNNIKNGFTAGTIVNFNNGEPLPEEKKTIEDKLKAKAAGTDNAGSVLVSFNDNKDRATTVERMLPNDMDKMYIELSTRVEQNLLSGHKITNPLLFGIKTPGQLGGRTELLEAFEIFKATYIQPFQQRVERAFNKILKDCGFSAVIKLKEVKPLSLQLSEAALLQLGTRDELREMASLPKSESQSTEAQRLQDLSPLVANSVLSLLTPEDVKRIFGIGQPQVTPVAMSAHDKEEERILHLLELSGESESDFEVVYSRPYCVDNANDASEELLLSQNFMASTVVGSVTDAKKSILDILTGNPSASNADISKALDLTEKEVSNILKTLEKEKAIIPTAKGITVTEKGTNRLPDEPAETILEVRYQYNERPGVPKAVNGSRPFCVKLMDKKKLYKRTDIEKISTIVGRDTWAYRGGFYSNPNTGEVTPYCRHEWNQLIVKRK